MKIQILPNWCKKLGLIFFIIGSIIEFINGFKNASCENITNNETITVPDSGLSIHLLSVLAIVGMLIYMLSKEKIEDDYINLLRLESFQLTAIVGLVVSIFLYLFLREIKFPLDFFITLFMWFYLITFYIKKRSE